MEKWLVLEKASGRVNWSNCADKAAADLMATRDPARLQVVRFTDQTQIKEVRVEVPTSPSLETLARALFNTDPRVEDDVYTRGCEYSSCAAMARDELQNYFNRAWDKNINGWRDEATVRAKAMLPKLGQ